MYRATPIGVAAQRDCGTEQHCSVAVMTTRMHLALMLRPMCEAIGFSYRQRVHIGTQADSRSRAPGHGAHHAGSSNSAMYLEAILSQYAGDEVCGCDLLERSFRTGVQCMPPLHHQVDQVAIHRNLIPFRGKLRRQKKHKIYEAVQHPRTFERSSSLARGPCAME